MRSDIVNCEKDLQAQQALSYLTRASIWGMLGNSALSSMYNQLVLAHRSEYVPPETQAMLYSALAEQALSHGDFTQSTVILHKSLNTPLGSTTASVPILRTLAEVLLQKHMNEENVETVAILLEFLKSLVRGKGENNMEAQIETSFEYHLSRYWRMTGQSVEAREFLINSFRDVNVNNTNYITHCTSTLLHLADIHTPTSSPLTALPLLLIAISLSSKFSINALLWKSTVKLAEVMLHLELDVGATAMVREVLPQILANGSLEDIADVHLVYAKCLLSSIRPHWVENISNGAYAQRVEDRQMLLRVLTPLEKAAAAYRQLSLSSPLLMTLYLQARVFDTLGMIQDRDKLSEEFKQVFENLEKRRNGGVAAKEDLDMVLELTELAIGMGTYRDVK